MRSPTSRASQRFERALKRLSGRGLCSGPADNAERMLEKDENLAVSCAKLPRS